MPGRNVRLSGLLPVGMIALALAAAVAGFHHSAVSGWWRVDDPWIIWCTQNFNLAQIFFVPEVWLKMGVLSFTPWLYVPFWLDLAIFGLTPAPFYAHGLVMVFLAGLLTYLLLRLWTGYGAAAIGALTFVVGEPVFVTSQQLMSRHYVEGLVFAIAAVICCVIALRRRSFTLSWIGAALYLIACLNKEVYAPLPLVLLFIPEQGLGEQAGGEQAGGRRVQTLIPFALASVGYLSWRLHMIGSSHGAFGSQHFSASGIFEAFRHFPKHVFGIEHWLLFTIVAAMPLLAVVSMRRATLPLALATATAVLLPFGLVSIADSGYYFHDRYALVPWWVTCTGLALATAGVMSMLRQHGRRGWRAAGYPPQVLILLAAAWHTSAISEPALQEHRLFDVVGRAIWDESAPNAVIQPPAVTVYPQFAYFLLALRAQGSKAVSVYPAAEYGLLHAQIYPGSTVLAFDETCACMREPARLPPSQRIVQTAALDIEGTWSHDRIQWRLGPYDSGRYLALTGGLALDVGRTGSIVHGLEHPVAVTVVYESPDGWVTWSSSLELSRSHSSARFIRRAGGVVESDGREPHP